MKILDKKDLEKIGFVNKTSGFKGNLSCMIDIENPEKLLNCKFLFLILDGLPVPFHIEDIEIRRNEVVVKFEDVNSEQDAKKLLQKEVYSEKFQSADADEEISWNDVIGYAVIDQEHGDLGKIQDVVEYPMQIIAVCIFNEKEILFPLNEDIVVDIDDDEKKIYVDLPVGLIDVYLK